MPQRIQSILKPMNRVNVLGHLHRDAMPRHRTQLRQGIGNCRSSMSPAINRAASRPQAVDMATPRPE